MVCKHFKRGKCKKGDKCAYAHESIDEQGKKFKKTGDLVKVKEAEAAEPETMQCLSAGAQELVSAAASSTAFVNWVKQEALVPRANPWFEVVSDDELGMEVFESPLPSER